MAKLESPINLTAPIACLWTVEEAGEPGRTHADAGSSCKARGQMVEANSGSSCCEAMVATTEPLFPTSTKNIVQNLILTSCFPVG